MLYSKFQIHFILSVKNIVYRGYACVIRTSLLVVKKHINTQGIIHKIPLGLSNLDLGFRVKG